MHRSIVKTGPLTLVTLSDKGKVVKSKRLEMFLFSDCVLYGKPVKESRSGVVRYIVYKQLHRSLVSAVDVSSAIATAAAKHSKDLHLLELVMYGNPPVRLLLSAATITDKDRWMEAFNPPTTETCAPGLMFCA